MPTSSKYLKISITDKYKLVLQLNNMKDNRFSKLLVIGARVMTRKFWKIYYGFAGVSLKTLTKPTTYHLPPTAYQLTNRPSTTD